MWGSLTFLSTSRFSTPKPSSPGICTSRKTRSGVFSLMRLTASRPLRAWPTMVTSGVVFRGRIFRVRRDVVEEPGSRGRVTREVVEHGGSVVLLPVFPDGRVLLVRQYRHAVGRFLWELVAGGLEPGESPPAAARRELEEETGYRARRLDQVPRVF